MHCFFCRNCNLVWIVVASFVVLRLCFLIICFSILWVCVFMVRLFSTPGQYTCAKRNFLLMFGRRTLPGKRGVVAERKPFDVVGQLNRAGDPPRALAGRDASRRAGCLAPRRRPRTAHARVAGSRTPPAWLTSQSCFLRQNEAMFAASTWSICATCFFECHNKTAGRGGGQGQDLTETDKKTRWFILK